jgi:hypothetical protein
VWFNPDGVQARKAASVGSVAGTPTDQSIVVPSDYKKDLELLEKEIATQDKALAGERDELTRITDISKVLITVAGVFAFLLGAGSWALLRDQRKDAKESLETDRQVAANALDTQRKGFESQIQESVADSKRSLGVLLDESRSSLGQVRSLRDEVERDFPMFGRMRGNFQRILSGLESACSQLGEADDSYVKLEWEVVQSILFYERAISTDLLFNTSEHSKQLSEIYRLLGVFYGSRFAFDKDGKIGTVPTNVREQSSFFSDLNRARFYFERSFEFDPTNYLAYFDAGFFTQFDDDLPLARISRDYFRTAAILGSQYQKPFISIALLELEAFKDAGAAQAALDRSLECKQYHLDRSSPAKNYISYLSACASCLRIAQSSSPEDPALLQGALLDLSSACNELGQSVYDSFGSDTKSFFHVLRNSPTTAQQFEQLAEKVRSYNRKSLPAYN